LKNAVRAHERQRSLTRAVEGLTGGADDATREEMLERLALETARSEARMELALDEAAEREAEARREAERQQFEAEAQQARARDLIEQMKREMGGALPKRAEPERTEPAPGAKTPARTPAEKPANPTTSPGARPDKTIGRM